MATPRGYFDQDASILLVKWSRLSGNWSRDRGWQLIFRRQGSVGRTRIKFLDPVLFKKGDQVWLWRTYTN